MSKNPVLLPKSFICNSNISRGLLSSINNVSLELLTVVSNNVIAANFLPFLTKSLLPSHSSMQRQGYRFPPRLRQPRSVWNRCCKLTNEPEKKVFGLTLITYNIKVRSAVLIWFSFDFICCSLCRPMQDIVFQSIIHPNPFREAFKSGPTKKPFQWVPFKAYYSVVDEKGRMNCRTAIAFNGRPKLSNLWISFRSLNKNRINKSYHNGLN